MSDSILLLESVREEAEARLKYQVKHHLLEMEDLKSQKYEITSMKYMVAWAEWMIAARQYTTIKKFRFVNKV